MKALFVTALASLFMFLPSSQQGKVNTDPIINSIAYSEASVKTQTLPESHFQPVSALELIYINKLRPYGTYPTYGYYAGQCVFYVASVLPVQANFGNANTWNDMAIFDGIAVGNVPKVGSVAQTDGDSSLGHVAAVIAVNPDGSFVVQEMNYVGLGVIDTRTTTTAEFQNFIYV